MMNILNTAGDFFESLLQTEYADMSSSDLDTCHGFYTAVYQDDFDESQADFEEMKASIESAPNGLHQTYRQLEEPRYACYFESENLTDSMFANLTTDCELPSLKQE